VPNPNSDVFLLVDDDSNDQVLIRRSFQKAPTTTRLVVAKDGDEALSYLSGAGDFSDRARFPLPSVILLDLKLPRRSGLEVLIWVRKHEPVRQVPVIILTSSYQDEDVRSAYDLGANSYLVKPVDLDDLETMMARVAEYWTSLNRLPELAPSILDVSAARNVRGSADDGF
jgi:CheY-like chemotaxis protein